ncbi:MAG: hypothetical protein JWM21_3107 [Acidobacteria bacterium]|nr:hypothetical protein [Acidobacteriota bacterium]
MKNFCIAFLICILLGAVSLTAAQSVPKCFQAYWLQGERRVNLKINGGKVTGIFSVFGDDAMRPSATYEFSGTLRGNILTVAFAGNKLPDVAPSEMKSLIWTLVKTRRKELLRIKFFGKNYDTSKYQVYFADFGRCDEDYATLAASATRVQFVNATESATFPVAFKTTHERKAFLLKLKAGQKIAVAASGCGISFYYPDQKPFAGAVVIDTWSSDPLTQGGDYLFVIQPILEPGKCSATFKVGN